MNNYAVINGKRIDLTEEHLKALGVETRKNPFERVAKSEKYCYIDAFDEVHWFSDCMEQCDDESFECSNYFNDDDFAKQVALHQRLYRKLLKFSYDNGCEDEQGWDYTNLHWSILYNAKRKKFDVCPWDNVKMSPVYFSSKKGALRAIEEVIKPFMKEHHDFVW